MNRAERRKLKRRMKGQDVQVNPDDGKADHSKANFCWLHKLQLDNIDDPSPRDKKLIESVRLVPFKYYDKSGKAVLGRKCGRCGNSIEVKDQLPNMEKESMLIMPEKKDHITI